MTEQEAREKLIENVAYELQQGAQAMRDWVAGLADLDPIVLAHQLAWSGSDIARAAEVEVNSRLLQQLQGDAGATGDKRTITELRNWYADQMMRAAANPEQSTRRARCRPRSSRAAAPAWAIVTSLARSM